MSVFHFDTLYPALGRCVINTDLIYPHCTILIVLGSRGNTHLTEPQNEVCTLKVSLMGYKTINHLLQWPLTGHLLTITAACQVYASR